MSRMVVPTAYARSGVGIGGTAELLAWIVALAFTRGPADVLAYMPAIAWRSGTGMVVWNEMA